MSVKKILVKLAFLLIFTGGALAQEPEFKIPDTAYEGLFEFKYRFWSKYITTLVDNDSTYIPLVQVFSLLKVYNEYSFSGKTLKGYFLHKDSTFSLDFNTKKAQIISFEKDLNDKEYIMTDLEIYVKPSFMRQIFGLDFFIDNSRLFIKLDDTYDMPIWVEKERKEKYDKLAKYKDGYAPLLFDRKWSILNGGIVSYNISASTDDQFNAFFNGSFGTGIELLGGSLTAYSSFSYSPNYNTFMYNYSGNWQYFFGNNPFITTLYIGDFVPQSYMYSNLPSSTIRGVSISNSAAWTNTFYSTYTVADQTNPDWQVEIWKDYNLYDHVLADPLGNYSVEIPVTYGSNIIETKFFGPKGEYDSKSQIIQISPEFLKPWEMKYSLSAGYFPNYRDSVGGYIFNWLYDGRFAIGLADWITNDFGVMKPDQPGAKFSFFESMTFNLFRGSVIPTVSWAPDKYVRSAVSLNFGEWGGYNLAYNYYYKKSEANTQNAQNNAFFAGVVPTALGMPFMMNYKFVWTDYFQFDLYDISSKISMSLSPLVFDLGYSAKLLDYGTFKLFTHGLLPAVRYTYTRTKDIWDQFTSTNFFLSTSYDIKSATFGFIGLRINQGIKDFGQFALRLEYMTIQKQFRAELRYNVSTDYFDNRTSFHYSDGGFSANESISGVMGFDSFSWDFLLSNPSGGSSAGKGAASFRYFVDADGDSEFDNDETLLPSIRSEMVNLVNFDKNPNSEIRRAYNLVPYGQYNVNVDKKSILNPLWIPTSMEYSFIADPNVYKPVNVPCYAAGVVEGAIKLNTGLISIPQSRVQLHLVAKDTTASSFHEIYPVFNDGSFYMMAVPPGDYVMYVDSVQQNVLDVVQSKPIEVSVKRTGEGDFVGNIELEIVPKDLAGYLVDGTLQLPASVKEELKKSGKYKYATLAKDLPHDKDTIGKSEFSIGSTKDMTLRESMIDSTVASNKNESSIGTTSPDDGNVTSIPDDNTETINPNTIKTLLFDNKEGYDLSIEMKVYLSKIHAYMLSNPKSLVEIVTHSDPFDELEKASEISKRRADAAMKYLQSKGIAEDRVFTIAKGSLQPIPDTNPLYGGNPRKNRRLEVRVIE